MLCTVLKLVTAFIFGLFVAPLAVEAQKAGGVYRIGFLTQSVKPTDTVPLRGLGAFRQRLRELGYVEGQNVVIDLRFADGKIEQLPALAAELVRLNPDVIVTSGGTATVEAKKATGTIPIVMGGSNDPVREGIVMSLARPGGNITGLTIRSDTDLIAKRLQLLKEVLPRASRLAIVPALRPFSPAAQIWLKDTAAAAKGLGLTVEVLEVRDPSRWDELFETAVTKRIDAVYPAEFGPFNSHAKQLADAALRYRIPTVHGTGRYVEAGSLLSYGDNAIPRWRRVAELVDKVLKGAKPADIPIEQPTKFELSINLKTAKALGLTIPRSVLLRADQVIE